MPIYDVFLSFRGTDTRPNFISHLYAALSSRHIKTFIDDKLDRGKQISSTLLKTIEESKISVIIFSESYADSVWCLDELVKIMECMKTMGQIVLPIFYQVDPSDVGNQTGKFGKSFTIIKRNFKSNRVKSWSTALTEAANLSGWDSNNYSLEADLCNAVACHIKKLCPISFTASNGLVGIDSLVKQILSHLCIGKQDILSVGLWGMGGIGKTTTAEFLYAYISDQFDKHCIFRDVRQKSEKFDLLHLRQSFISLLLGVDTSEIQGLDVLPTDIHDTLSRMKVLVIFDDISNTNQLEALGVTDGWFGPGSRIIITSRDKQILHSGGVDQIYEVMELNYTHACQLLRMRAFPKKHPEEGYRSLMARVVDYCKGVPLALKVLGSQLCQKSPKDWESLLKKLEQCPDSNIMDILRISYDSLDQMEKTIFLDIACFFKGNAVDWLKSRLYDCDCGSSRVCCCSSNWTLIRLEEKCLITINDGKKIGMHDLIEEMGKDIAGKEGSRLWNSKEIWRLLRTNKGSEAVEGIVCNTNQMAKVQLDPAAFLRMPNLRILKFCNWQLPGENEVDFILQSVQSNHLLSLPDNLRLLHWPNYPFKSLPSTFFIDNLIELNMQDCKITQLWDGDKNPQNLKWLNLSGCQQLVRLPNLSSAISLYSLDVSNCGSLDEIDSSMINSLRSLTNLNLARCKKLKRLPDMPTGLLSLNLEGCKNLRSLPSLIQLKSLKFLQLSKCSNLKMLPEIPNGIHKLELNECGVEEWSRSVWFLENLRCLSMRACINITRIPINVHLNFNADDGSDHMFMKLDFCGCHNLGNVPVILGKVREINLGWTGIKELPCLRGLSSLVTLDLKGCSKLVRLSHLDDLGSLKMLDLSLCSKLVALPRLNGLSSLRKLSLRRCSNFARVPPLNGLSSLQELNLDETALVEIPNDIVSLSSLTKLSLKSCERLKFLPKLPENLAELQVFGCTSLITVVSSYIPKREGLHIDYKINYFNCVNLDQNTRCNIIADTRLIIKEIAIATNIKNSRSTYRLEIPGSEIPEWVTYKSQGCTIAIDFPLNCFDADNFLGIAFFLVLDFDCGYSGWLCPDVEISCCFRNSSGEKLACFTYSTDINAVPETDHVILWYDPFYSAKDRLLNCLEENGFNVNGEFEFIAIIGPPKLWVKFNVKKCGVHLIYDTEQK